MGMNIQNIVKELLESGYSQKTLAEALTSRGVPTDQSTIHRMASNANYKTKADKAFALLSLHQELKQTA